MNKFYKVLIIPILTLFISCQDSDEKDELNRVISSIENLNAYKQIVIIPGVGCGSCIEEGEMYVKNNIQNDSILFILTRIESLKLFKLKTGLTPTEYKNVVIDKENFFLLTSSKSIYPCFVNLREGNIIDYSFESP